MAGLRVVFMGSPAFVVPVLEAVERFLEAEQGSLMAVYTAPDRPVGRGRNLQASPIKEYASERGYDVLTPAKVTPAEEQERFRSLDADLVVLAAYGLLLPKAFLFEPKHGAVNVHPSLLPRHRGASPVAGALLAGDDVTGTTIIKMDEGLDTGPVLAMEEVALDGSERAPELTERLFALGARVLEGCLPAYVRGDLVPHPQAEEGATTIKRFSKEDGWLDWSCPAVELERRVRALDPWPGTATTWEGKRLDVLEAAVVNHDSEAAAGTVVSLGTDVGVATGEGVLVLKRVRLEGRKPLPANDFVRGRPDFVGSRLPS